MTNNIEATIKKLIINGLSGLASGITEKPMAIKGKLHIELRGPDGELKDERFITNTVMAVGDAHVAMKMTGTSTPSMGWMAVGTVDTNDDSAQTTLGGEVDRNAVTSRTQGAGANDNDVIYVCTWAAGDATATLKEAGIFNANAAGTMLCRAVFAGMPKGVLDSLTITWTLTHGAS